MTKKTSRTWTADEKLQILEEARQPNTSVAEVLRRHRVDGTTFYRWEREAKAAMREALSGRVRRVADRKDDEIARLQADLDKKRLIIAEVVEENLALKRGL
jgi:transposase